MSSGVWIGLAVFAVGTYALRFGGMQVVHRRRREGPVAVTEPRLLTAMVAALLAAVAVGSAVIDDDGTTDVGRGVGVAVGGLFALRGAPLVLTMVVAAVTTALIRLLSWRVHL